MKPKINDIAMDYSYEVNIEKKLKEIVDEISHAYLCADPISFVKFDGAIWRYIEVGLLIEDSILIEGRFHLMGYSTIDGMYHILPNLGKKNTISGYHRIYKVNIATNRITVLFKRD